jgi:hypothetical protein
MNRPFCASNKQLERKWQDMAYQRHREKVRLQNYGSFHFNEDKCIGGIYVNEGPRFVPLF